MEFGEAVTAWPSSGYRSFSMAQKLTVAITGAAGSIGSRLAASLSALAPECKVVGVDTLPLTQTLDMDVYQGDLRTDNVAAMLEGVDVAVHLVTAFHPRRDGMESAHLDDEVLRRLLAAIPQAGVKGLVLMSSAMVYGAWENNTLPLEESAPLRPNPGFRFAAGKAEMERLAADWHAENPDVRLVVLRPVTAVSAGENSWVSRSMRSAAEVVFGEGNPCMQFLHLDDLASAVEMAVLGDLNGVYNVAPDGYVSAEDVRRLNGRTPRPRFSSSFASRLAGYLWRLRLAPTPPGIVPYIRRSWIVSNERLRAAGWVPRYGNEEAYVSSHHARPWAMMSSAVRQRQVLWLSVAAGSVALGTAIGVIARRRRLAGMARCRNNVP